VGVAIVGVRGYRRVWWSVDRCPDTTATLIAMNQPTRGYPYIQWMLTPVCEDLSAKRNILVRVKPARSGGGGVAIVVCEGWCYTHTKNHTHKH